MAILEKINRLLSSHVHESHADQTLSAGVPNKDVRSAHPNGHFYSPVVDPEEISARLHQIWPKEQSILGIDFNDAQQHQLLADIFPVHLPKYDYPEKRDQSQKIESFFTQNSQFSWLDARAFFVFLCEWRPKNLIEVGSGFSTLMAADVKHRFLDDKMKITCIEPYPRPFLQELKGVDRLLKQKVQDVSLDEYAQLGAGDVLFVDSSHVSKTGSDVNFLYFEVFPRLNPGVHIHVHDIFFPHDYPRDWVVDENRSWNEQYLLRALLMYSTAFKVDFSCSYAFWKFPELLRTVLALPNARAFGGGSIWLRRV